MLLFETGLKTRYYIPKLDVRQDLLRPTGTVTRCPYKGRAAYYSVDLNGQQYDDIACLHRRWLDEPDDRVDRSRFLADQHRYDGAEGRQEGTQGRAEAVEGRAEGT